MKKNAYTVFMTIIIYRALRNNLLIGDNFSFHLLKPQRKMSAVKYLWKLEIERNTKKKITFCYEGTVTEDKDSITIRELTKSAKTKL